MPSHVLSVSFFINVLFLLLLTVSHAKPHARSRLTKKAEPQPNGGVANLTLLRATECAIGCWLRRLVRPCAAHLLLGSNGFSHCSGSERPGYRSGGKRPSRRSGSERSSYRSGGKRPGLSAGCRFLGTVTTTAGEYTGEQSDQYNS
jgi:hypothetical protein